MRPVYAKRQGIGFTVVPVAVLSIALMMGVLWSLGNPELVHACKCAQPGTPSEELEKFATVFAGRVVSIQHSYDPNTASVSPEDRTTVGFEVSTVWKGTVHEDMHITTPPIGGSCGFSFVEGKEYIVYGHDSNYADGGYTLAYAVGPPFLIKRKPISTLSGTGMLLKPGLADQRPKNHKTRLWVARGWSSWWLPRRFLQQAG